MRLLYHSKICSPGMYARLIRDLLYWFPCNDNDASAFIEVNGNNGSTTNVVKEATGHTNCEYAYDFNGSSAHALIPISPTSYQKTISFWLKYDASSNLYVLFDSPFQSGKAGEYSIIVHMTNSGTGKMFRFGAMKSGSWSTTNGPVLTADTWYRIILTCNHVYNTSLVIRCYVNGAFSSYSFSFSGFSGAELVESSNLLVAAQKSTTYAYYYDGLIDDIKIWDGILSDVEIKCDYNEGKCYK